MPILLETTKQLLPDPRAQRRLMQICMAIRTMPMMVSLQMLGMLEWKDRPGTGSRTNPLSINPHLPHLIAPCTEDIELAHQRQRALGHDQLKGRPCYMATSVTPPI